MSIWLYGILNLTVANLGIDDSEVRYDFKILIVGGYAVMPPY